MAQPEPTGSGRTLRERKRQRTHQALIDAATDLFERQGYDETTVAEIAARADIGTRTFFSYFTSKEQLLFSGGDARVQAAVDAIATRRADEGPADVLLRALRDVGESDTDMIGRHAAVRMQLVRTVPTVRGRALQVQLDAEREIAGHLHAAFPDELDEVSATALVGAFVGAISGALLVLLDGPTVDREQFAARLREATDVALRPWLRQRSTERDGR